MNYEVEHKNAMLGLNPFMGEWKVSIAGRAVPYSSSNRSEKERWQSKIKEAINGNRTWIFSQQVTLSIELRLDYQSLMETNEIADLDNYAKLICDSLKGPEGIVIDDCQFQRLDVAWVDAPHKGMEETILEFRAAPDDFFLLPVKLYELSDGLFYPMSDYNWTAEGPSAVSSVERDARLIRADAFSRLKKLIRHSNRMEGLPKFRSFQSSKFLWDHISVMMGGYAFVWGFHKSRIIDSGFEIVSHATWSAPHKSAIARLTNEFMGLVESGC